MAQSARVIDPGAPPGDTIPFLPALVTGETVGTPLRPEVGVLALCPGQWDETWQVRHQVLTRLSRYFHVLWCQPSVGWREHWLPGGRTPQRDARPTVERMGNITVYRPGRWVPFLYRPRIAARFFERQRLRQAIRLLRARGCTRILLYIWRPEFASAVDLVDVDRAFYHIDDEYSFSVTDQETSPTELALIKRVDQVFVHSPAMMEKKGHINPHTLLVSNGVDYHAFATPVPEPADMRHIPRPRIGYMGILKDQLDFGLLAKVVERHPEWSFVFVGPRRNVSGSARVLAALETKPNVFFLGGKSLADLPAYAQHFDVGTLCYHVDGYTKYINPLKLNEYLAAGRPVVGVPLPSIEAFGDVVRIARTEQEWSAAIRASLSARDTSATRAAARQAVARRLDWSRQTHMVAKAMCERLDDVTERSNRAAS